eukprot:TRINITY_DN3707_c0_g1_i1.p1 TRINITY_DN3707_c0_g1~~TRINITY_DN3707_c0_g1_i1.p1  ORF type:complete len:716 (+),score=169.37 TRINITY_DN3707_c0_g1_i1:918-3065(+)
MVSCAALQTLYLQNNLLYGAIPSGLVNLPSLEVVILSNNAFDSAPADLVVGPALLDVSFNKFSGPLPLPGLVSDLYSLNLAGNMWTGPLPNYGLGNLLNSLDITNCSGLYVECDANITNIDDCLPDFLSVDYSVQTEIGNNVRCFGISGNGVEVKIDPSYLLYLQCHCDDGYFAQLPRDLHDPLVCIPCPDSCTCSGGAMSGCYPEPFGGPWSVAQICPEIGIALTPCNPLGNRTYQNFAPQSAPFTTSQLFGCLEGYYGRLCSRCVQDDITGGYYLSGSSCIQCETYLIWLLPLVYIAALLVLTVYLLNIPGSATGLLKIAVFFFQAAIILIDYTQVSWPPAFSVFLQQSSTVSSFSIHAIECVFRGISVQMRHVMYMSIPVCLVVYCVVIHFLGLLIAKLRGRPFVLWRERCVYMALFFLLFTYFDIVLKVMTVFGCTAPSFEGVLYVNRQPWIACIPSQAPYNVMLAMAVVGMLLYVVGIPVLIVLMLVKTKRDHGHESIKAMLGFVSGCYGPKYFWWEGLILVRRVLLALSVVVMPFEDPSLVALAVMVVLQVAILLQHLATPYRTRIENRLELASLYVLYVSFITAFVMRAGVDNNVLHTYNWLLDVIIALNVAMGVVLILSVLAVFLIVALRLLQRFRKFFGLGTSRRLEHLSTRLREGLLSIEDRHAMHRVAATGVEPRGDKMHQLTDVPFVTNDGEINVDYRGLNEK